MTRHTGLLIHERQLRGRINREVLWDELEKFGANFLKKFREKYDIDCFEKILRLKDRTNKRNLDPRLCEDHFLEDEIGHNNRGRLIIDSLKSFERVLISKVSL